MTADDPDQRPEAEEIYADFVRRRNRGEAVDIDAVCEAHPRLAHVLRALDFTAGDTAELASTVGAAAGGSNFNDSIEEVPGREGETIDIQPGDRIGPYLIGEALGEGGFAVVFRAEQREPVRRTVALKSLKLGIDTKQVLARFEAERQALALMNHSHIAKVFDAGMTARGRPYFVMELVEGVPISGYCDEHRLTTRQRLELFLSVCDAVSHAHQKAIIHRDLKPSNVLVTVEGDRPVPKIIDFGIAKATEQHLTEATLQTEMGQVMGTPEYMSPEQASGEGVDTRTDIYALGVILYELLTSARPFDAKLLRAKGIHDALRILREDDPPLPSSRLTGLGQRLGTTTAQRRATTASLRRELRGDLDWITMKALAKDPEQRYQSAAELAADVQRHLDLEPVLAGPPGTLYRLGKFARRRKRTLLTLAALLATTALVGWGMAFLGERKQLARGRQERTLGKESLDLAQLARRELLRFEDEHKRVRATIPSWQPIWERGEEIHAWEQVIPRRHRLEEEYSQAFLNFTGALTLATPGSELWSQVLQDLSLLTAEIQGSGQVSLGTVLLKQQIESTLASRAAPSQERFESRRRVHFTTAPSAVEIFCFQYREFEQRLLPLPYAPGAGLVGEPFLRVEEVWDRRKAGGLRGGDRIVAVDGEAVQLRGDLAARLHRLKVGQQVTLAIDRQGQRMELGWTPFQQAWYDDGAPLNHFEVGRMTSFREQLGLTFEGYPLAFDPRTRVGVTAEGRPVTAELPEGSYLFVFRRQGYVDARYPVRIPREEDLREHVQLLRPEEMPPGFVYVPAGWFTHGGADSEFLQNLEFGESRGDGFLIGRYEVTVSEYLTFLTERVAPEDKESMWLPRNNYSNNSLLVRYGEDGWEWANTVPDPRRPIFGISYLAASEYAGWRTEKENGPWRYRLPTDKEWEKAARGADGRTYVWGDYFVWSFCWGLKSSRLPPGKRPRPAPRVGMVPSDESVFGVRDLAGSLSEFTSGRPLPDMSFASRRGGAWDNVDIYEFRTDCRVGYRAQSPSVRIGIRLVAERK